MLNVKKTLTKLMPTVGTNYIIFCGVGVAWGSFTSASEWSHQAPFGITFSANPVFLVSKAENISAPSQIAAVSIETTKAIVSFSSNNATTKYVNWIAIGKV